jgi:ribonuclease HI
MHYLYCDGASRGNPGPASTGWHIDLRGQTVQSGCRTIGKHTCNHAEWQALIDGLEAAKALKVKALAIRMDSSLVVNQFMGKWKIKNERLLPLANYARELAMSMKANIAAEWIPRERNGMADALANRALDMLG